MPVDTSIYQNQPNPLGMLTNVLGAANAAQTNQLLQQAQKLRQSQYQQGAADDLRLIAGTMGNTGASPEDTIGAVMLRGRQAQYPPEVVNNYVDEIRAASSKGNWKQFQLNQRAQAAGTSGLLQQQQVYGPGAPAPINVPATSVPPGGARSGYAPGAQELATGPGGAQGVAALQASRNDAPNQSALLENLNSLSNEAVSGPSSDFEKRANALIQRLMPGTGITLNAKQLAASEEYGKISEQLAGQQAVAGHATNAFLTQAYNTNPSLYLSKIGRQGITHMLQGNLDSNVAKANAWDAYAAGQVDGRPHDPGEFSAWNAEFNRNFNPRAFQYARMTPDERSNFRSTMNTAQQQVLHKQLQDYQSRGWLNLSGNQ